jgi:hypothetical protein
METVNISSKKGRKYLKRNKSLSKTTDVQPWDATKYLCIKANLLNIYIKTN